jgi:hypothetical protein
MSNYEELSRKLNTIEKSLEVIEKKLDEIRDVMSTKAAKTNSTKALANILLYGKAIGTSKEGNPTSAGSHACVKTLFKNMAGLVSKDMNTKFKRWVIANVAESLQEPMEKILKDFIPNWDNGKILWDTIKNDLDFLKKLDDLFVKKDGTRVPEKSNGPEKVNIMDTRLWEVVSAIKLNDDLNDD